MQINYGLSPRIEQIANGFQCIIVGTLVGPNGQRQNASATFGYKTKEEALARAFNTLDADQPAPAGDPDTTPAPEPVPVVSEPVEPAVK